MEKDLGMNEERQTQLIALAKRLGLPVSATLIKLLDEGTTHASATSFNSQDYNRLEFLGDSVLDCLTADLLIRGEIPLNQSDEGTLTKARSRLTENAQLAHVAKKLALDPLIRTGDNIQLQDSIRADVVEALFGACYLVSGLQGCIALWQRHKEIFLDGFTPSNEHLENSKSLLQEFVQHRTRQADIVRSGPTYRVIAREGPDHAPRFHVQVSVKLPSGHYTAEGQGGSKLEAELDAAAALLKRLRANG